MPIARAVHSVAPGLSRWVSPKNSAVIGTVIQLPSIRSMACTANPRNMSSSVTAAPQVMASTGATTASTSTSAQVNE